MKDIALDVSYNQPKLNAYASWNTNAMTFATSSTVGTAPHGIFVNTKNTVYAVDSSGRRIHVWENNSVNPTRTYTGNWQNPTAIFVSVLDEIYISDTNNNNIVKLIANGNNSVSVMFTGELCWSIFVDIINNLYCSAVNRHKVLRKSLSSNTNITAIIAGTGCQGSSYNMLNFPHGIFVDTNLDLYVADADNHRIQLFLPNELNAITVAGSGSLNMTIMLSYPCAVTMDANKYLFIVDIGNHRIVGSGPNGFRCIVGCSGPGSASNQLFGPLGISFDSFGNIFVTEGWFNGNPTNNRIQKFTLLNNTLGK